MFSLHHCHHSVRQISTPHLYDFIKDKDYIILCFTNEHVHFISWKPHTQNLLPVLKINTSTLTAIRRTQYERRELVWTITRIITHGQHAIIRWYAAFTLCEVGNTVPVVANNVCNTQSVTTHGEPTFTSQFNSVCYQHHSHEHAEPLSGGGREEQAQLKNTEQIMELKWVGSPSEFKYGCTIV